MTISWHKLATDEPLAHVTSVARWAGGFVAVGDPVPADSAGTTTRTPVWTSIDGSTWRELDPSVFGPKTVVIGVGAIPSGLVALTLQGGRNQCEDGPTAPSCTTLSAPLQSWTSTDGSSWAAHAGPDLQVLSNCDGCGIDPPILTAGPAGAVVAHTQHGTQYLTTQEAFSPDGVAWHTLRADAFPAGFTLFDVAATRSGFLAAGATGGASIRPAAFSSTDGLHWTSRSLSTSGLDPTAVPTANHVVAGPDGVIVVGSDGFVPGTSPWWSSVGGGGFTRLVGYPPLGVYNGEGAGTGLIPNGDLLGDGERMVAYRGGDSPAGWTSTDGRTWRALPIDLGGDTGAGAAPVRDFVLTPVGLLAHSSDGAAWLGRPAGQHEAVILHTAGTTQGAMAPIVGSFVPLDGGAATCDSVADGRAVSAITALELGELGSATLRGTISLHGADRPSAEFWVDGGDLPEGSYQPFWSGPASISGTTADDATGTVTFTDLKREIDGSAKPGTDAGSPAADGWPATLSGTMSWSCQPW